MRLLQISAAKCVNKSFLNIEEQSNQKTIRYWNSGHNETCTSSKSYTGKFVVESIARNYKNKYQIRITDIRMCFR